jgi:hypothetical protein
VHKARGGRIAYKWSHNNKFVRVMWQPKLHDLRGPAGRTMDVDGKRRPAR